MTDSEQTLIDILTAPSVWFEFVTFGAAAGVVGHTDVSTFAIALISQYRIISILLSFILVWQFSLSCRCGLVVLGYKVATRPGYETTLVSH